jgi:hypothetical protein
MWRADRRRTTASLVAGLTLLLAQLGSAETLPGDDFYDARGGRLELRLDARLDEIEQREMRQWIESIAGSLAAVYGHWPRKHWRVFVQPTSGAASDPIPWAQVDRGDVDEVRFYVVASTPGNRLIGEWTGYHELAHLLIPYRGWGDTWFSEGLASYYQNLLQARSGLISEQQMWQKLYDGFQRGRDDHRFDGQNLRTVSAQLRTHGGFMRVYWSGAWYFLAVDLELRRESGGKATLDRALRNLNQCCADSAMSVPAMVRELDRLNGVTVFSRFYDRVVASTAVPDFESLYRQLGLRIHDDQVVLAGTAEQAAMRAGFITPGFQSLGRQVY